MTSRNFVTAEEPAQISRVIEHTAIAQRNIEV